METPQNYTRTVAFFVGPDTLDRYERNGSSAHHGIKSAFERRGAKVLTPARKDAVDLNEIYGTIQKADRNLPLTVVILAHGMECPYGHGMQLGYYTTPTHEVFQACSAAFAGKPIDVFLNSCYSGGALDDLYKLPESSVVAATAEEDGLSYFRDDLFIATSLHFDKRQKNHSLSALDLLKTHLINSGNSDAGALYGIHGSGGEHDIEDIDVRLSMLEKKGFMRGAFKRAKAELGGHMTQTEIKNVMSAITRKDSHVTRGKKLAVALAMGIR